MAISVTEFKRARRTLLVGALCGLLLAALAVSLQPVGAQAPLDDPTTAYIAARAHLSADSGIAPDAISVARAEPVTWSDGCLGLATSGEFCTQALVDGWALWLRGGDALYRYHTDADGSVLRSAGTVAIARSIPELPLPAGGSLRLNAPAPAATGSGGLSHRRATAAPVIGLLLVIAGGAVVLGRSAIARASGGA